MRLAEGYRSVPVRLRHQNHTMQTSIEGLDAGATLRHPIDARWQPVALAPEGLVLNDYLAARLGVGVGDVVDVEVLDGRRQQLRLPVTQLVTEHVGVQAYMNLDALNRALGDGDLVSGALLTVDDGQEAAVFRALDRRPRVIGSASRLASVQSPSASS